MCLIVFSLNSHPHYPLILIANRDEFYERPTTPVHKWENTTMYAGKDLKASGTWMGITESGRFAAVTNYRDLKNIKDTAKTRGDLPLDYLLGSDHPKDYLHQIHEHKDDYNGFNLLTYRDSKMYHYSNYEGKVNSLDDGVHGLSNALLDTPWPKVTQLKETFETVISGDFNAHDLMELLNDQNTAGDEFLPDTGVSPELEKALSAICIRTERYGTCSSSVLMINNASEVSFLEKSYPVGDRMEGMVEFNFKLQ